MAPPKWRRLSRVRLRPPLTQRKKGLNRLLPHPTPSQLSVSLSTVPLA